MNPRNDLNRPWSLRELVDELANGRTNVSQVHEQARARIEQTEAELHAWVRLDPSPSLDAGGPLRGAPMGVKDIIDVAALPTGCGSALRADARAAPIDAAVVTAWRRAGAVPFGKTVTTEFAYFAPGLTRNPAAPGHTPGGSSSGSAASVAAGQVPLAVGSQTAGSVTRPASFCGVAAMVMSHGRFASAGVTGLSPSLDSHGVFAAGVSDLALAWSALTGGPDAALGTRRPPRVLFWSAAPVTVLSGSMRAALDQAKAALICAGADIVDFPDEQLIAEATLAHPVVMAYEAARERAAELGELGRLSKPLATLLATGVSTDEADYIAARAVLARAAGRVRTLLGQHDVIVGAAAPGPAPKGLHATGDPVLSLAWQGMGLPVVTVPGLVDADGLPLGLQVIGAEEHDLLAAACAVERAVRPAP